MGSSKAKFSKARKLKIDFAELKSIMGSSGEKPLDEAERNKVTASLELLEDLLGTRNDESLKALYGEGEEQADGQPAKENKKRAPGHGRRKPEDFKSARHVEVTNPDLKHGEACPCGCGGKLYRTRRPKIFRHFVGRPPLEVTIYEREELRCNKCEKHFAAPLPASVGPETYEASAVTVLALSRYGTGIPLYRQAAFLGTLGVPIAVATQYDLIAAAAQKILPVYQELVRQGAQGKLAHFDDTRMTILKFVRVPDDKRNGIHTTGVLSIHDTFQVALFFTGRDHAGENMAKLLAEREPDLPAMIRMSDALSSNFSRLESDDDVNACCIAHGRRNFVKIADNFPVECHVVLTAIGTIYHNDNSAKENSLSPDERLAYHQEKSTPILDDLKIYLNSQLAGKKVEPNSTLGKAMQYLLNHWQELTLFLRVAGAPLDNNIAERLIKKAVLHRKNSLFYRTLQGAKTGDIFMSLIYSCQMNGANPFEYLTALQRHADTVKESPPDWMPWNYAAALGRASPNVQPAT